MRTALRSLCLVAAVTLGLGCKSKPPLAAEAPPWLDAKIEEQAKAAAPDTVKVGATYKGVAQKEDGTAEWNMQLDKGKCYWFSGVGDPSVEQLYLLLDDPTDSRVSKKKGTPSVVMMYCAESTGMYRLEGKVTEGRGHFGVGIWAKDAPPKDAPEAPPAEAPKVDLGKLADAEAAASAPGATRIAPHFTGKADKTDWFTELEGGKCYWFVGVGGEGINELYLYLWDPNTTRVADNKSESSKSSLGHCPKKSGMFKFQAKVNSGDGDYVVGVYMKPAGK